MVSVKAFDEKGALPILNRSLLGAHGVGATQVTPILLVVKRIAIRNNLTAVQHSQKDSKQTV